MNTQPIDPVESVLAIIGVKALISKDVERFGKGKLEQAEKLPNTVEKLSRQLCRGDLVDIDLSDFDYDKTLKDLFDGYRPEQVEAMVKALEPTVGAIDVAFMAKSSEVIQFLQGIFPRSTYTRFLGAQNLVPNDMAIYQFTSVLEVLENPMRVFPLMANGSISKRQINAVRTVYPTLSAAIDETLISIVADMKVAKNSWELPPEAEMGVTKWFGNPVISPKLAAQLKAVTPKPKEASPSVPVSKSPKSSALAKESLSSAQRAAMGTIQ